jgi:hypothetical protein
MTPMLLERFPALEESVGHDMPHRLDGALLGRADAHGRLTLDDLITSVWEGLAVRDTVNCPVCAGPMTPGSSTTRSDSTAAACFSCGSQLS